MQRLHAYYACMILWKVFPCGHPPEILEHPEHTVSVLVPVIPKHSKILIRLMEEITTWNENKPGKKQGTNYLSSGAGFFFMNVRFQKVVSFFNVVAGGAFILISFWIWSGGRQWIRVFPKRCKTSCFFSWRGHIPCKQIEMIGFSLGNSWCLSVCWHLTFSVFSDAFPARYF